MATANTPLLEAAATQPPTTWAGEEPRGGSPTAASLFSCSVNLAACALGASMLSLPYTMMLCGPLIALEALLLLGAMSFMSAQAVVAAGRRSKVGTYSGIVRRVFGRGWGAFADLLLNIALLVAAVSYVVGLADLLPEMLPPLATLSRSSLIVAVLVALFGPTCVSGLGAFGPASAIAAAGCYLQAAALVLQVATASGETAWSVPAPKVWISVSLSGLLYSLPMISFVYAFHFVLTDTLADLQRPTITRISLVNLSAVFILLGCYLPVAIAGYLAYGGTGITPNVLAGLAPRSPVALIAKWSIGALLLITYSLFIIPLRRKLEVVIFDHVTSAMNDPRRITVAIFLNAFVAIAAILLPDLGMANTIAGGCIALIMFFFPGALMVQHELDVSPTERSRLRLALGCVFVFLGILICSVGLFGGLIFDF